MKCLPFDCGDHQSAADTCSVAAIRLSEANRRTLINAVQDSELQRAEPQVQDGNKAAECC
jgi:hypothetical protein